MSAIGPNGEPGRWITPSDKWGVQQGEPYFESEADRAARNEKLFWLASPLLLVTLPIVAVECLILAGGFLNFLLPISGYYMAKTARELLTSRPEDGYKPGLRDDFSRGLRALSKTQSRFADLFVGIALIPMSFIGAVRLLPISWMAISNVSLFGGAAIMTTTKIVKVRTKNKLERYRQIQLAQLQTQTAHRDLPSPTHRIPNAPAFTPRLIPIEIKIAALDLRKYLEQHFEYSGDFPLAKEIENAIRKKLQSYNFGNAYTMEFLNDYCKSFKQYFEGQEEIIPEWIIRDLLKWPKEDWEMLKSKTTKASPTTPRCPFVDTWLMPPSPGIQLPPFGE